MMDAPALTETDTRRTIEVLVPWAEGVETLVTPAAPRAATLEGTTVGILDNGWHCMHVLAGILEQELREKHRVADVIVVHTSGSLTMTAAARAELMRRCSAVVLGIGTCGSCTRWVAEDAITLEREGVPTISLYTEPFAVLGSTLARTDGLPELPMVVLPHPLNSLPDDEIRAAGRAAFGEIFGGLVVDGHSAAA
jgi:hypothetical protein